MLHQRDRAKAAQPQAAQPAQLVELHLGAACPLKQIRRPPLEPRPEGRRDVRAALRGEAEALHLAERHERRRVCGRVAEQASGAEGLATLERLGEEHPLRRRAAQRRSARLRLTTLEHAPAAAAATPTAAAAAAAAAGWGLELRAARLE